ncbi:hypothetical protein AMTR_s00087p00102660 [Amborella trichopoda]|uniref:BURP domain-containing protein n=1 Tax=Amborella trichopoda TaxID=13333 RepID=W1P4S4_AMBTC|nr:hypothetical protein AMTR_s00087p00102660 [Amborella trichopoda]
MKMEKPYLNIPKKPKTLNLRISYSTILIFKKDEDGKTDSHHPLSSSQIASTTEFEPESSVKEMDSHFHKTRHDHSPGPGNGFFHMKDLKVGNKLDLYDMGDTVREPTSPLPRHETDSLPFAFASLTDILHHCSIPPDSPEAKKVARNFHIWPKAKPQVLATTAYNGDNRPPLLQSYVVKEIPVRVTPPSVPVCHPMTYPYALFFCHAVTKTTALMVKLEDEDESKIDFAAACHLDPSDWDTNHVSFKVLGITPGTEPVCHFTPKNILNSLEAAM